MIARSPNFEWRESVESSSLSQQVSKRRCINERVRRERCENPSSHSEWIQPVSHTENPRRSAALASPLLKCDAWIDTQTTTRVALSADTRPLAKRYSGQHDSSDRPLPAMHRKVAQTFHKASFVFFVVSLVLRLSRCTPESVCETQKRHLSLISRTYFHESVTSYSIQKKGTLTFFVQQQQHLSCGLK